MFDKKRDFIGSKRTSEPLHIVFHKHLHGSAVDRTRTLDRHVDATGNRHVRAKKNWTNWRIGESVNRCVLCFSFPAFLLFVSRGY